MKVPVIIFLAAIVLLLIVAYLAKAPEERFGSKAYHMLLLGLMRLDMAVTQGVRYIRLGMERVFKSYHPNHMEETIHRKEQRIREYRTRNLNEAAGKGRRRYKRKILD